VRVGTDVVSVMAAYCDLPCVCVKHTRTAGHNSQLNDSIYLSALVGHKVFD
jgi:hypothetical protein